MRDGFQHPGVEIANPVTGSHLTLRHRVGKETQESILETEAWLPQGWRDARRHLHPLQEERVRLLEGKLVADIGALSRTYAAGESFIIPAGIDHSLSVSGAQPAHLVYEITPPLRTGNLSVGLHRLAVLGLVDRWGWPKPLAASIITREFRRELVLAEPQGPIRQVIASASACLARSLGYGKFIAELTASPPMLPASKRSEAH